MPVDLLVFGAHPDDCELKAGGVAAKWAARGHKVKFVATTNGDVGHFAMAGGPLALRRTAEVKRCAEMLGIETQVLDIHDGELLPTIENRRTMARLIRQWQADIVLGPRPYDYHPDHRYTGVLMEDAAVLVADATVCGSLPSTMSWTCAPRPETMSAEYSGGTTSATEAERLRSAREISS